MPVLALTKGAITESERGGEVRGKRERERGGGGGRLGKKLKEAGRQKNIFRQKTSRGFFY